MAIDKNLANRLLDAVESLYLENQIMKLVLAKKGWVEMEKFLSDAKSDPQAQALVRHQFAPVRKLIESDSDLAKAIQEFLRVLPIDKKAN